MIDIAQQSLNRLLSYCKLQDFQGWDCFDGLNSKLFTKYPLLDKSRYFKILWMQFFKRCPINFRIPAQIKQESNPKGLGLFISGFCKQYNLFQEQDLLSEAIRLAELVINQTSKGFRNSCWGYNFPWQSRFFYQTPYSPTVVATSFIAHSLLDLFSITGDQKYLDIARSSCDFILYDLNRTYDGDKGFIFSYSPNDHSQIFNASLLGAGLLSRVYWITRESQLAEEARKAVIFCSTHQQPDGSWPYGLSEKQQWIDNFHTGYNLSCMADYAKFCEDSSFHDHLEIGILYYIRTFFTEKGIPKFYHNKIYPIDIHAAAQLPVTLSRTGYESKYREIMDRVIKWTISHMQHPSGYFYYQKHLLYINKIPYMRWSQAWMFYGLSEFLKISNNLEE